MNDSLYSRRPARPASRFPSQCHSYAIANHLLSCYLTLTSSETNNLYTYITYILTQYNGCVRTYHHLTVQIDLIEANRSTARWEWVCNISFIKNRTLTDIDLTMFIKTSTVEVQPEVNSSCCNFNKLLSVYESVRKITLPVNLGMISKVRALELTKLCLNGSTQ